MSFGEGTEYSVSGITVYDTGIRYDGVFYAAKDEQVSLTMDDPSDDDKKYIVNYGTIIGSGTQYKIVMPDRNVIVSTIPTKLSTPENLSMVPTTLEGGVVTDVTASWSEVPYADGYYLTPYRIDGEKWTAVCDAIRIVNNVDSGSTLSCSMKETIM